MTEGERKNIAPLLKMTPSIVAVKQDSVDYRVGMVITIITSMSSAEPSHQALQVHCPDGNIEYWYQLSISTLYPRVHDDMQMQFSETLTRPI